MSAIPEGWIESRLTPLLFSLETGSRPSGGVAAIETGTPSISGEHFDWTGQFDFSSLKFVPDAYFEQLTSGKVTVGAVLVVKDGATTGKCAFIDERFPFPRAAVNEHVFLVRTEDSLLNSRFLFELLRSDFGKAQILKSFRGAAIGGIPRAFTDHVKILLPTLPEQQRIVDVLRQAEEMAKAKRAIGGKIDLLVKTMYWEHFGAWYTPDGLRDSVRISEYVDDSQYGVSEAMDEEGSHAVLRMNSITTSGWLDLSDLKYANLSKRDADSTILKNGDLLFNRTNSKELVGKCAIWRGAKENFSYASYLVRFRLKHGMLPEYLWATLNSAYGKYRLVNAAKQAVSMANVSPTDLGRITVPLPPLPLQEKFAQLVTQIEALRTEMLSKIAAFEELRALVTQQGLLGELTSGWREQHRAEILNAARARDELLRERCAKVVRPIADRSPLPGTVAKQAPTRRWLLDELSVFQQRVFSAFVAYTAQPLLADDPEAFAAFCANDALTEQVAGFSYSPDRIRRTLSQLAALGLIARITLPHNNSLTLERQYLQAFRPLRDDEHTQFADVEALRRALSPAGEVGE